MNTSLETYSPSWPRLILAFTLAAIVPTLLVSCFYAHYHAAREAAMASDRDGLGLALIYAQTLIQRASGFAMLGLLLGGVVPALVVSAVFYAVFRRRIAFRPMPAMLVGGLAANCQAIFLEISNLVQGSTRSFNFWQGERHVIKDGHRTFEGWIAFLEDSAFVFGFGALGGLIFWWMVRNSSSRRGSGSGHEPS